MFFNPMREIKSLTTKLETHAKAQDVIANKKAAKVREIEVDIREATEASNFCRNWVKVMTGVGNGEIVTVAETAKVVED